MASPEGPTAAATQAMNLSLNEPVNKGKTEPSPLSSNSTSTVGAVPPAVPENVPKPASAITADETSSPAVTNSAPTIPAAPSKPQNPPENADSKPANGLESAQEPAPAPEKMDTSEPPKAPVSTGAGTAASTPAEVPENLSQAKAPETTTVVKEIPSQGCDNATEKKVNCENSLPPATQEKIMTSGEKENAKILADHPPTTTPNNGAPKIETPTAQMPSVSKPIATIKPMVDPTASSSLADESKSNLLSGDNKSSNKRPAEDTDEPEKRLKTASSPSHPSSSSSGPKGSGKSPEQILEYMEKTFDHRRKIITKQMPTIPELKELYPDLFRDKQLVIEFQRITKIDIDQKVQEFCVRNATAVIEMARGKKGAVPVLTRWEQAKQENEALKQYWDMVTALCLLPLHFGENFVEMVLEIGEDEEVQAQGKIVPTLVARGNIFRTDEFFLIAENTIVQEFEEFTIAFASLYSSYWVFNMVYPETIENTYNFIQRCIVKQKEPGAIPTVCKNFTKTLQKWNKTMKKT